MLGKIFEGVEKDTWRRFNKKLGRRAKTDEDTETLEEIGFGIRRFLRESITL